MKEINFGFNMNMAMEQFPVWHSRTSRITVPVTRARELVFNAHGLGLRKIDAILGAVKRTKDEGLALFLHSTVGFSGVNPRPEIEDGTMSTQPFNTIVVSEHSATGLVYLTGRKQPVYEMGAEDTAIISQRLSAAAMAHLFLSQKTLGF